MTFEDIFQKFSSLQLPTEQDYPEIEKLYSLEKLDEINYSPSDCEFTGEIIYDLYPCDESGRLITTFTAMYIDGDLDCISNKIVNTDLYDKFVSDCKTAILLVLSQNIFNYK